MSGCDSDTGKKALLICLIILCLCFSAASFYLSIHATYFRETDSLQGEIKEEVHRRLKQIDRGYESEEPITSRRVDALDAHRFAVAHVTLKPVIQGNRKVFLYRNHGNNDVIKSVVVEQDGLRIKHTGYYFIYSQVTFIHGDKPPGVKVEAHSVYRHNYVLPNDGNEQLLRNSRTVDSADLLYKESTSFSAGIYQLRAGDRVFVNVSDVTSVSPHPHASYIGLHGV